MVLAVSLFTSLLGTEASMMVGIHCPFKTVNVLFSHNMLRVRSKAIGRINFKL